MGDGAEDLELPGTLLGKRPRVASDGEAKPAQVAIREKKFPCPYEGCDKRFVRPVRLEEHIRSHTNERPFVCPFEECDNKAFLRQSHLDQHVKQTHTNDRKWVCEWEDCGKSFVNGTRLRAHIKGHETKFYCTEYPPCKEVFRKKNTLQKHIDKEHLLVKPFRCTALDEDTGAPCEAGFDKALKLRQHEAASHGVKRYWCTLCQPGNGVDEKADTDSAGFGTYSELQEHLKIVHPPTCEHCSMVFTSRQQLTQHLELHHLTFEERATHVCPEPGCGKAFTKVSNLRVHVRTVHQKVREWVCGESDLSSSKGLEGWDASNACAQSFGVKSSLEGHVRKYHFKNGELIEAGRKRAKTALARQTQSANDVTTAARLTNGYGDSGVRELVCIVEGCDRRFARDFDVEIHCLIEHGLEEDEIGDALAEQKALSGGPFWVRGARGFAEEDEDEFSHGTDAVQVGAGSSTTARVEPFGFIAEGGLSRAATEKSTLDPALFQP